MLSILYVDDEPDLLEIARLFLEQDGVFRVDTTTSASAALPLLIPAQYDAIISDYQMPGKDGIQFLKEVRASGNTIPFIIFTGRGREEIVIEALNEGADFYLQKGGEPEAQYAELTNKIIYAVQRKRAEDALWRNEVRLNRAEEVAGFGNWEIHLATNAVTASKGARTLYGLPDDDLTIQDILSVPLPKHRPLLDAALNDLVNKGVPYEVEFKIQRKKDGKILDIYSLAEFDPLQRTVFGVIHDITGRKRTEAALRKSEESYRGLFNTVRQAIYIIDEEGTFVDVNDGAEVMYGYAREEFKGKTPEFLSAPGKNDFPAVVEQLRKAFSGEPQQFEFWGLRKNHEVFPKDVRLYKGMYFGRDVLIAIGTDITERKKVEVALEKSRIQLAEAMDQAHLVNWEFDVGTGIFTFDDRFYALYGTTAEIEGGYLMSAEIYAKKFVHPDDQHLVADEVKKAIKAVDPGYESHVEHRIIRRDGEIRYIVVRFGIIKDENGRTIKTHGVNQDITRLKRVDEALEQSEEKFRLLVENSHDIIYTLNLQGVFTFVSPSWVRLLGHPFAEVVGKPFLEFVHPDDNRRCQELMQSLIETGQRQTDVEYRVRHADGTWRWYTTNAVPLHDKAGKINGAEGIASDITRRKEYEVALCLAGNKLKLLSGITRHDINNQLMVLAGNLRMLQKKHPDTTHNENFHKVETAVKRISSMIQFTKEYEEIGVNAPVWQDILSLVDTAAMQAPLGTVILENDLPKGTEVFADPLIIKVLYNLMDNAMRYGGKTTTIRFFVKEFDTDHILVCEDDGIGVPAEEKEKIFERGFGKNTGLGLALSREILSITGITIREAGDAGNGARFEMRMPKEAYRVT
ncbi:MAG: PAS domain S-box protein [Methanomicrobiales archaeon]